MMKAGVASNTSEVAATMAPQFASNTTSVDVTRITAGNALEAMLKITVARQGRMQTFVQSIDLSSFFQGTQYRIMSALFGPMTCFFCIA